MNTPRVMLKVIVFLHFILSAWGSLGSWLQTTSYQYVHTFVLACGLWAIISAESTEALIMMLISLGFSIVHDIILLGLYEPRGFAGYEEGNVSESARHEYRFALGMCITNLILKPFTGFLLYRIYQSRKNESAFTIPGIGNLPGLGPQPGGYEDIDHGHSPEQSIPATKE